MFVGRPNHERDEEEQGGDPHRHTVLQLGQPG